MAKDMAVVTFDGTYTHRCGLSSLDPNDATSPPADEKGSRVRWDKESARS